MKHYLGISPEGPTVFRHVRKDDTGEPLILLDQDASTGLRVNLADWLEDGETISSASVTAENCTATLDTASPNVDLTISAAVSFNWGRAVLLITSSEGDILRQVVKIRRTNRYTDEQKYRDYA